jgi:predicted site-specific integrase-resolvase
MFKAKGQAMQKEIVTVTQLAKRLQLKPETIRIWARKGLIPSLHPTPKTLRFEMNSVLTAMEKTSTRRKEAEQC